jgi:hypothetical protein
MILDNLEDSHDLTFEMIHRACVRKLRRRHDRGADRSPEHRPATPHSTSKDKTLRNLRSKGLSRAEPGDVSVFLVNFLAHRGIKARTVLKEANLDPDNLQDAFAVRALFEAPSLTCLRRSSPTPTPPVPARTVGPTLKRHLPLSPVLEVSCLRGLLFPFFLLYMFIVGSVQGFFS